MTSEATVPLRIDIVSDVVCPWCAIGGKQLEKAMTETGIEADIHWHPFELNPQMPAEGQNLREHIAEKYGTAPEDSAKAREKMTKLGEELGFTFNYADDMRMVNTFKAHQLLHWAEQQGRGADLKWQLFQAFFGERKDLNEAAVLVEEAAATGLDRDEAAAVLADGRHAEEVRQIEQFFLSQGIQGVPAMIFDRQHLVTGAQGVERYAAILRHLTGVAEAPAGSPSSTASS